MTAKLRDHLTYANVVSTICLFILLGGTSYALATGSIDSREIKNGTIKGKDVRGDTLTGTEINESALGKVPSAAGADVASTVPDGAITGRKLGPVTVETELSGVIANGATGTADAFCPVGNAIAGGGRGAIGSGGGGVIYLSRPIKSNVAPFDPPADGDQFTGWRVGVYNGYNEADLRAEVWVVCVGH